MIFRSIIFVLLLLPHNQLWAQTATSRRDDAAIAADELEAVINDTDKLDNKNAVVQIKARAAQFVSFSDPPRAEAMFQAVWKFANDQVDESFDKKAAKLAILKHLFSRNPKLARQLLNAGSKHDDMPSGRPRADGGLDESLGAELTDSDPAAAAGLLENALSAGPSPRGIAALIRLRENNPILADFVAARYLDLVASQPSLASLAGLFMMTAYAFPGSEGPTLSAEQQASLENVQYRYFISGREVLIASLAETTEALVREYHYNEGDLQYRAANQAQVAAILAALAPRFQPLLAPNLNAIAAKLAGQVPPNVAAMTRFALNRLSGREFSSDNPEEGFVYYLSKADFDEARKQLDRIPDAKKREIYLQLLIKVEARSLLKGGDVMGAITLIRKLDDSTTRLVMYLDAMKVTKKKRDSDLTNLVVNEARLMVPQTERNGLHLRALLSFAALLANGESRGDALEFLNNAATTINALGKKSGKRGDADDSAQGAMDELNDPLSLLEASEMDQAFSSLGPVDLERVLTIANRIDVKPVQMIARLDAISSIIKRRPAEKKTPPKAQKEAAKPKG
jgi:hypothetical protein